ncbi:HlyD family type I secretion periplasmic adaptor subunit [Roseibium sp. MMSF_3412]|uniref:HlyD family type I secretion periplasmic adaptor subunit n=1 Tax=Roseibium sp. MMSF_3412 TaxID=3046712 RepID=UPI00273E0DF6|nr:HlyD family type I secretion periplasmic adaptor subunit [Roseibium sp. MMSF_3412]
MKESAIQTPAATDYMSHTEIGGIVSRGKKIVYTFLAVFLLWGLLVPLQSSIVAEGTIAAAGRNKLLQHEEGGRIRSIEVAEGAKVAAGDLIMLLDAEAKRAELSELQARQAVLLATKAHLEALRTGAGFHPAQENGRTARDGGWKLRMKKFDAGTEERGAEAEIGALSANRASNPSGDPIRAIFASQQLEQRFADQAVDAEIEALRNHSNSLTHERAGLVARHTGLTDKLRFLRKEIAAIRPLVRDGYVSRARAWKNEREESELVAEIAFLDSEIARIDERRNEAGNRVEAYVSGQRQRVAGEMTRVLGELAEIRDRVVSAERALANTEIRAPVSGTLVSFSANTVGGVVRAGDTIGEIVPSAAALTIHARVRPQDIAEVRQGQSTTVSITALDSRKYAPLSAVLTYVSADAVSQTPATEPYYLVHARPENVPANAQLIDLLKPGMVVNAHINAGRQPFLVYLLSPLFQSFDMAFAEP